MNEKKDIKVDFKEEKEITTTPIAEVPMIEKKVKPKAKHKKKYTKKQEDTIEKIKEDLRKAKLKKTFHSELGVIELEKETI